MDRMELEEYDVRVNVYDLWDNNVYTYPFGCGIFHSGIEVHGTEYAYGAHDYSSSGIFETVPRKTPGTVKFRDSYVVGTTKLNRQEVTQACRKLGETYRGDMYHLLLRNCNHFSNDMTQELTGKSRVPSWVNRLAKIAYCCRCLLPPDINPPLPTLTDTPNELYSEEPLLLNSKTHCPVPHPNMLRDPEPTPE